MYRKASIRRSEFVVATIGCRDPDVKVSQHGGSRSLLKSLISIVVALALAGSARAEIVEVELTLPMPAKLDIRGRTNVVVTPFLSVSFDGENSEEIRGIEAEKEFNSYLERLLRRYTELKVLESGPLDYPTTDLSTLAKDRDFWRYVGETTQADLILAGAVDFDIEKRAGYRVEPFSTSTTTYYRQVLVERSGYEFDILMLVIDGETGALLYADNFKDFREFERARKDPLRGMYENLDALEGRIIGIFAPRWLKTPRAMFSH